LSGLLVIEFPSEEKAEGVRETLLAMQREYLIELGDAVVAAKDANGRIKLNQLFQPVKQSAVLGLLWGSLIGLLFMMPLAGAAIGAASGALGGRSGRIGPGSRLSPPSRARSRPRFGSSRPRRVDGRRPAGARGAYDRRTGGGASTSWSCLSSAPCCSRL
jgi:hypothetical protein